MQKEAEYNRNLKNSFFIGGVLFGLIVLLLLGLITQKVRSRKMLEGKNRQLEELSCTDPLTGVLNRRGFRQRVEEELVRFERNQQCFSFVIGDVDNFKEFNDRYGHDCGDYILTAVGQKIIELVRKQDVLAR